MKIKSVEVFPNYMLRLEYANGEARLFNGKELHGLSVFFDELKDPVYFKQVKIDPVFENTVIWPHGQDMAPEWLYEKSEAVQQKVTA